VVVSDLISQLVNYYNPEGKDTKHKAFGSKYIMLSSNIENAIISHSFNLQDFKNIQSELNLLKINEPTIKKNIVAKLVKLTRIKN